MTAVRGLGRRDPYGCIVLSDTGSDYRDGSEETLLEWVSETTELGTLSDGLVSRAADWPTRYHLDPARANVLRSLDLPRDAAVLEIGAGCGAVTRYVGETCGLVDALEPAASRARVARARTRDLPNVEVFVGELDDVPQEASYDVVLVIGVLEYVGSGDPHEEPYSTFLQSIERLLNPGGRLVLAIENALGVKYLVGAPEDHSGALFQSIEGYPTPGPARTFSRRQLERLVDGAGLRDVQVFQVFPDYKLTRTVLSGKLGQREPSLLKRLPDFPSPDWVVPRPHLADERCVWGQLVDAGLADQTGNSLLVVAGRDGEGSALWPRDQLAAFFSVGRASRFATDTRLVAEPSGDLAFVRRALSASAGGGLDVDGSRAAMQPGTDFVDAAGYWSDETLSAELRTWVELLRSRERDGECPIDLVPHNLVVAPDGELVVIDEEWGSASGPTSWVVDRGLYWLGVRLAPRTPPSRWPTCSTVRDVVTLLARVAGQHEDDAWLAPLLAQEAELQARVHLNPGLSGDEEGIRRFHEESLAANLEVALEDLPLGRRLPARAEELRTAFSAAEQRLGEVQHEIQELVDRVHSLEAELLATGDLLFGARMEREELRLEYEALASLPGVRVDQAVRRVGRRLRPGSDGRLLGGAKKRGDG
ncbi:MAG: methyltransferase [Actinomycetes bacterium]